MSGARSAAPAARPRRPARPRLVPITVLAVFALAFALAGPAARPTAAAAGVTLDARALLAGHGRVGSWMAIAVTVANDGPALAGELRLAGGAQGRTRFGLPVDLPTGSRKSLELYAQPPSFGQSLDVTLVTSAGTVASAKVAFAVPDNTQLTVGVVAEKPQAIISSLRLPSSIAGTPAVVFPLTVGDLPGRVEAWDPIDRLVWQDTDSSSLRPDQITALRGWLAGGGHLTIVGGTAGASSLAGLPDDILPFRPGATIDISPTTLQGLVGPMTTTVLTVPALAADRTAVHGRTLAVAGDQVVAAEAVYGSGTVTLVGIDPTGDWLARTPASDALWNRIVPSRSLGGQLVLGDDSQLLQALNSLPSLALPPVGGLLVLLAGYILLVGPLNYLLLRRLDRREWAWITMPLLVVGFAVAAYVYGGTLRGGQVIINEVAIVRGALGTTVASATAYVGVFSPTRETYQLEVPGGALLSPPLSGDMFSGFDGTQGAGSLDILQGETGRVRDLAVGYGALRAVRAEAPVAGPSITADLRLEGDRLKGTVTNHSTITLEKPAIVLGGTVDVLGDLAPGATGTVDVQVSGNGFGQSISDRIVGQVFFGGVPSGTSADDQRLVARQALINQLSFDPMTGMSTSLSADGAVLLAFGRGDVIGARVQGTTVASTGNVLYYVPLPVAIRGKVTFTGDLMRGTTVSSDNQMFGKGDPSMIAFNGGTLTQAYRPPVFDGTFQTTRLLLAMNQGGAQIGSPGQDVKPTGPGDGPLTADEQLLSSQDGMPFLELFDRTTGSWVRLPHVLSSQTVSVADPSRYVDPSSGGVLVRFHANDQNGGVGLSFQVQLEGTVQ